ncbi:hypothetical protein Q1695_014078 [Nippostrongylus brasiliensis]|nr:hypothetical protein Q1695_014078 [Nippostrongylus brasiliensis]
MLATVRADEYADLMRSDVTARVLPLNISINSSEPVNATCSLTLHNCTAESALLHSPTYASFSRAVSVGWLSIRQAGVKELLISCDITLCHFCDDSCRAYTPPRSCRDTIGRDYNRMWNESAAVERVCNPLPDTTPPPLTGTTLLSSVWNAIALCTVLVYLLI